MYLLDLATFHDEDNFLGDIFIHCQALMANSDVDWILSKLKGELGFEKKLLAEGPSQLSDFLWPGCAVHGGLSIRADLGANLPDLRLEAHVLFVG